MIKKQTFELSVKVRELGLAVMLLGVVVVFLLCNVLALIANLLEVDDDDDHRRLVKADWSLLSAFFWDTHPPADPDEQPLSDCQQVPTLILQPH